MKAKRFVIEYANYKIDQLYNNQDMQQNIKNRMINRITTAICMYETGVITVDETMQLINNPGAGIVD